ncbi:pRiA4b ORF-3-like protein [Halanaerobium saccharolyticum]|uniref:PRiA4b ORF-3-like protein n=1 Tax=Halanaerobium saccharolyticum TaxID=43595 RepID=A0A4R6RPP1_9FIRM|nr:plasmid pRiA4b ORF-3 family protein [Halanaerobium saccharolyticum]TDP87826.1 pRiA4b ORF-3-like protein [Halanaerobium saccharolyticum]
MEIRKELKNIINKIKSQTKIIDDFDKFTEKINEEKVRITKTQKFINGSTLMELNGLMETDQLADCHNRTPQYKYKLLNLLYYLALAGKILKIDYSRSTKYLIKGQNFKAYKKLSEAEKYLFLMETFWLDCDLEKMQAPKNDNNIETNLERYLSKLLDNQDLIVNDQLKYFLGSFLKYLSYLDLWQIDFLKLKLTEAGKIIIPILINKWSLKDYNIPLLRKMGYESGIYGARMAYQDPFWIDFADLFPEATGTIPREVAKNISGNYIFKIKLGKIWRKVKIAASATLADLHLVIQELFDFDDDHLYSFFMSNKPWDGPGYGRIEEGRGFNAAEKKLSELGLDTGQEFIYIFDYGTEWRFKIKTESFLNESEINQGELVDSKGENPEQYRF